VGSCRGRPLCLPAEGVGWTIGDGDRESRDERQEMRGWPETGDYERAYCVQAVMAEGTGKTVGQSCQRQIPSDSSFDFLQPAQPVLKIFYNAFGYEVTGEDDAVVSNAVIAFQSVLSPVYNSIVVHQGKVF